MADVATLQLRCARAEASLKALEASLDATNAALHKLRGQVHGPRGGRPRLVHSAEDIPAGDKDSLREYVGLKAGTKYTHNSGE
jgi:outer membrane protein TolC